MKAYSVIYMVKGSKYCTVIDAKDVQSLKQKIAKKHDCKRIKILDAHVVGYF